MASSLSYWCYHCTRVFTNDAAAAACPFCHGGGFIQLAEPNDSSFKFNPLVALLDNPESESPPPPDRRNCELYYVDESGVGLRPLPPETQLGPVLKLILDHFSQILPGPRARPGNQPASKRAVASLPSIQILPCHVDSDSRCAVCTDSFTLGAGALGLPCKHIYHSDCILPWLNRHNACPVCRHELPTDEPDWHSGPRVPRMLWIWSLPDGVFSVRMVRMPADLDVSNLSFSGGVPTEIDWEPPWLRQHRGGGFRRFFGYIGSIFKRALFGWSGLGVSG